MSRIGAPGPPVEPAPEGLPSRDPALCELVRVIDEARVPDPERPVPVVGYAIVAEAVDVIDLQPVVVHAEEVVARERPGEVRALPEAAEVVLREWPHECVLVIAEARVVVKGRECDAG